MNLKDFYSQLQDGKFYRVSNGTLWVSNDLKYIHWQNFGQSAHKNTIDNLGWCLKHIFGLDDINKIDYRLVANPYAS